MCANGDRTCTEGLAECGGPEGCNGHGYVTAGGRKYRKGSLALAEGKALAPVVHERCGGRGLVACGCEDLGLVPGTFTPREGITLDLDTLAEPIVYGDAAAA